MQLEAELKKLGLSDKEAAVYLSCLQLGPSPAQRIARRAKVVRATTYVVLESLMQRGLITQYKEGKKTLFSAEPPRQLMRLLEKQEDIVKEQKHYLEGLLPELQVLMKAAGPRPSVGYFDGKEGLHAIRQDMVRYCDPGDVWYNFTPVDHLHAVFGREQLFYHDHRVAKGIASKTIFTTRDPALKKELLSGPYIKNAERRYVAPEYFPGTSGMTIYKDRIAIGTFTGKLGGVIIENKPMADMMERLFDLAWLGAGIVEQQESRRSA